MSIDTYYYPYIKSLERICCLQKEQAEGHIKRQGGELIEVPTFLSEDDAEEWIKEQPNPSEWEVGDLPKTPFNPEIAYCVIR